MEDETESVKKTSQQIIREIGELIHSDEEINQDGLPVYFRIKLPGHFWLVVDMINKDEIGVDCPVSGYKVVNQIVANLILEIALAHIQMAKENEELKTRTVFPTIPFDPHRKIPGDGAPYEITCSPQPHILEPDEIPPGTTIAGENNETE